LGDTWVTPSAVDLLGYAGIERLLARHASCNWGDVSPIRARANALALEQGLPLLSHYISPGLQAYVLTEADRTATWIFAAQTK
jgi:hypothetical protein